MWSKPSSVLSTYTGKHELEDATGRFHASLAFRRALVAGGNSDFVTCISSVLEVSTQQHEVRHQRALRQAAGTRSSGGIGRRVSDAAWRMDRRSAARLGLECSRRFRGIPKQYEKQNVPFYAAYRRRTTSIPARTAAMCLWGSRPTSSVSTDLSIETISTGRLKPAVEPTGASRSAHQISPCWITIPPVAGRPTQWQWSSGCRKDLH